MTILVGVLCKDGVVMGADGSATFAAGDLKTIEQPTTKIEIVFDQIVIAGTGQIGLGQRFCRLFNTSWGEAAKVGDGVDACRKMCEFAINDFASTRVEKGQYGALVAFPFKGEFKLCEFAARDLQPELKTDKLWYVSMGSGQLIVDPFLALMRRVFWTKGLPTHQDATFAVYWALRGMPDVLVMPLEEEELPEFFRETATYENPWTGLAEQHI